MYKFTERDLDKFVVGHRWEKAVMLECQVLASRACCSNLVEQRL